MQVLLPKAVMQLDPRSAGSSSSSSSGGKQSSSPSPALPDLDPGSAAGSSSRANTEGPESSAEPLAVGQGGEQHVSQDQVAAEPPPASQESAAYPPLARAKRLSYCLATALPGKFEEVEGRQVLSFCISRRVLTRAPLPSFLSSRALVQVQHVYCMRCHEPVGFACCNTLWP